MDVEKLKEHLVAADTAGINCNWAELKREARAALAMLEPKRLEVGDKVKWQGHTILYDVIDIHGDWIGLQYRSEPPFYTLRRLCHLRHDAQSPDGKDALQRVRQKISNFVGSNSKECKDCKQHTLAVIDEELGGTP